DSVAGKVPVVLVANKADLTTQAQFGVADLTEMAETFGCTYVLTSAKTVRMWRTRSSIWQPKSRGRACPAFGSQWRSLHKPRSVRRGDGRFPEAERRRLHKMICILSTSSTCPSAVRKVDFRWRG